MRLEGERLLPASGHAREGSTTHELVLLETVDPVKGPTEQHPSGRATIYKIPLSNADLATDMVRQALLPEEISASHRRRITGRMWMCDSSYQEFFSGREQTRLFMGENLPEKQSTFDTGRQLSLVLEKAISFLSLP